MCPAVFLYSVMTYVMLQEKKLPCIYVIVHTVLADINGSLYYIYKIIELEHTIKMIKRLICLQIITGAYYRLMH